MPAFLLIILGILAASLVVLRKRNPAVMTPALILVACAMICGALVRLSSSPEKDFVSEESLFAEANGYMLGKLLAEEVAPGSVVAVVRRDPAEWMSRQSICEASMRGLEEGGRSASLRFVAVAPASDPGDEPRLVEYLHEKEFRELLAQVPDAKAVVLDRIVFRPNGASRKDSFPPMYLVIGAVEPALRERLEDGGYLRAVADYRPGSDWTAKPSRQMAREDIFAMRYEMVVTSR